MRYVASKGVPKNKPEEESTRCNYDLKLIDTHDASIASSDCFPGCGRVNGSVDGRAYLYSLWPVQAIILRQTLVCHCHGGNGRCRKRDGLMEATRTNRAALIISRPGTGKARNVTAFTAGPAQKRWGRPNGGPAPCCAPTKLKPLWRGLSRASERGFLSVG